MHTECTLWASEKYTLTRPVSGAACRAAADDAARLMSAVAAATASAESGIEIDEADLRALRRIHDALDRAALKRTKQVSIAEMFARKA
jgi:hypothetical protein